MVYIFEGLGLIIITVCIHLMRPFANLIPPGILVAILGSLFLIFIRRFKRTTTTKQCGFTCTLCIWNISNFIFLDTMTNPLLLKLGFGGWNKFLLDSIEWSNLYIPDPIFLLAVPVIYVLFCFFRIQVLICFFSLLGGFLFARFLDVH